MVGDVCKFGDALDAVQMHNGDKSQRTVAGEFDVTRIPIGQVDPIYGLPEEFPA